MRAHTTIGFSVLALLVVSAGCGSSGDDSAAPETPAAGGAGGSAGQDGGTGGTADASLTDGNAGQEAAAGTSSPDAGTGGAPADAGSGGAPADAGSGGASADAGSGGAPADAGSGGAPSGTGGGSPDAGTGGAPSDASTAGLGCSTTPRKGFTSLVDWPTVAACGTPTGYAEAVAAGASTCASGWHMCTLTDVNAITGYPPDFVVPPAADPDIGAWIAYIDTATGNFAQYYVACNGTLWKTADLQGTGPCSASGNYPDGYRLRVSAATWGGTHDTSLGCMNHADHACGYPGGTVPLAPQYTLCCLGN